MGTLPKKMDNCNIKWNNFSEHIKVVLFEMFKSNYMTDITLVCDDKEMINAHKIVLAACSDVFKSFINNLPTGTNSLIFLRGIKYIHLKSILEYIYLGATTIQNDSMKEFYDVAKDLELVEIYTNLAMNKNEFILKKSSITSKDVSTKMFMVDDVVKDVIDDKKETKQQHLTQNDSGINKFLSRDNNMKDSGNELSKNNLRQNDFLLTRNIEKSSEKVLLAEVDIENVDFIMKDQICEEEKKIVDKKMAIQEQPHLPNIVGNKEINVTDDSSCIDYVKENGGGGKLETQEKKPLPHNDENTEIISDLKDKLDGKEMAEKDAIKQTFSPKLADNMYHCQQCNLKTKLRITLYRHFKAIHEGIRYPCSYCDKKGRTNFPPTKVKRQQVKS